MKTATLIAALQLAKPSLGGNDSLVPILSHFCFLDDALYAYNELTAVIVDEATGLTCALHGDTLLGLLQAGGAEEVTVEVKDGTARLKMGNANWIDVPSLNVDDSPFQLPDETPLADVKITPELLLGLERCLLSVGEDSLKTEYAGVTLQVVKGAVTLYSTDNKTATRVALKEQHAHTKQSVTAVLPTDACTLLLKLATAAAQGAATLSVGTAVAVAALPGVTLVTRLYEAKVAQFEKIFAEHFDASGNMAPTPDELPQEIAKAAVLVARDAIRECTIQQADGSAFFRAHGTLGKMASKVKAAGKGAGIVSVDPGHVQRVVPYIDKWAINDRRSLLLAGGDFCHIISSGVVEAAPTPPPPPAKVKIQPRGTAPADRLDFDNDIPF